MVACLSLPRPASFPSLVSPCVCQPRVGADYHSWRGLHFLRIFPLSHLRIRLRDCRRVCVDSLWSVKTCKTGVLNLVSPYWWNGPCRRGDGSDPWQVTHCGHSCFVPPALRPLMLCSSANEPWIDVICLLWEHGGFSLLVVKPLNILAVPRPLWLRCPAPVVLQLLPQRFVFSLSTYNFVRIYLRHVTLRDMTEGRAKRGVIFFIFSFVVQDEGNMQLKQNSTECLFSSVQLI